MEAHVKPMMEEDVKPSFGLAFDEGKHRDHTLGFQHSLLQRHNNKIYNVINPPLRIGLREAELSTHIRWDDPVNNTIGSPFPIRDREMKLPSQISCVDLDSGMRQSNLHKVQHPHVKVFLCAGVCAFNPSLAVGWQDILSWYPMEWAMDMVVDTGVSQQYIPVIWDTKSPNWHWDLGGTTYHFPGMSIDYNLDGTVYLEVEHTHSLGESQLALVSN